MQSRTVTAVEDVEIVETVAAVVAVAAVAAVAAVVAVAALLLFPTASFWTIFNKNGGPLIETFHVGRDMGMLAVMTTPRCDLEAPISAAKLQNRTFFLILAPSCIHLAQSSSQRLFKMSEDSLRTEAVALKY